MKTFKRIVLSALLCCAGSVMAFAEGIDITIDEGLNCTVTDNGDLRPPSTTPPIQKIGLRSASATNTATTVTNAQLSVYNSVGQLVYTATEPVNPNSTLQIDVTNWSAGEYTIRLTLSDGTCKETTFELK